MISLICEKYGIKNYTVNDDGSIDVNGRVNLYNKGLTELFIDDEESTDFNNDFQASVRYTLNP